MTRKRVQDDSTMTLGLSTDPKYKTFAEVPCVPKKDYQVEEGGSWGITYVQEISILPTVQKTRRINSLRGTRTIELPTRQSVGRRCPVDLRS